jgi:hypothetical protein
MEHTGDDIQLIFYKHNTIHQRHDTNVKPHVKEVVKRSIEDVSRLDLTQLTIEKPLNAILQTLSIEFFDTLPLFYFFGFLMDYATSDFYYLNMHFYT